jgi:hypothetical protein
VLLCKRYSCLSVSAMSVCGVAHVTSCCFHSCYPRSVLLQRDGVQSAVVEHVFGGGRVKVYIPKQNCELMFAISAIRCPSMEKVAAVGFDGRPRPVSLSGAHMRVYVRLVCVCCSSTCWHVVVVHCLLVLLL